jgi:hypothetical protein
VRDGADVGRVLDRGPGDGEADVRHLRVQQRGRADARAARVDERHDARDGAGPHDDRLFDEVGRSDAAGISARSARRRPSAADRRLGSRSATCGTTTTACGGRCSRAKRRPVDLHARDVSRQANAAAANQVDVVVGVAEALLSTRAAGVLHERRGGDYGAVGIGEDSTTTHAANQLRLARDRDASVLFRQPFARLTSIRRLGGISTRGWRTARRLGHDDVVRGITARRTIRNRALSGFIEG